jgi:hypothetical protein
MRKHAGLRKEKKEKVTFDASPYKESTVDVLINHSPEINQWFCYGEVNVCSQSIIRLGSCKRA